MNRYQPPPMDERQRQKMRTIQSVVEAKLEEREKERQREQQPQKGTTRLSDVVRGGAIVERKPPDMTDAEALALAESVVNPKPVVKSPEPVPESLREHVLRKQFEE